MRIVALNCSCPSSGPGLTSPLILVISLMVRAKMSVTSRSLASTVRCESPATRITPWMVFLNDGSQSGVPSAASLSPRVGASFNCPDVNAESPRSSVIPSYWHGENTEQKPDQEPIHTSASPACENAILTPAIGIKGGLLPGGHLALLAAMAERSSTISATVLMRFATFGNAFLNKVGFAMVKNK